MSASPSRADGPANTKPITLVKIEFVCEGDVKQALARLRFPGNMAVFGWEETLIEDGTYRDRRWRVERNAEGNVTHVVNKARERADKLAAKPIEAPRVSPV